MATKLTHRLLLSTSKTNMSPIVLKLINNNKRSLLSYNYMPCQVQISTTIVCNFHLKRKPGTSSTNFTSQAKCSTPKDDKEKKPSLYQRVKAMYKDYWYVVIPVHLVTSAVWFGGFYYLAVSGFDIVNLLEVLGAPDSWISKMRESKAGGLVTAYTMYKIATPARYAVTLGGTTFSINYLKTHGWIKPMPNKDQLKTMYHDRKLLIKEDLNKAKEDIKEEFIKTQKEITKHMKEAKIGFTKSAKEAKEDFKAGVKGTTTELSNIRDAMSSVIKKAKEDNKRRNEHQE